MSPRQSGLNLLRITQFVHRNLISFNETRNFLRYKAVHFNFWMNTTHDWAGNETFAFYDSKLQWSMLTIFLEVLAHFTGTHTVDSQRALLLIWRQIVMWTNSKRFEAHTSLIFRDSNSVWYGRSDTFVLSSRSRRKLSLSAFVCMCHLFNAENTF